jgi:hypothetical protein
MGTRWEHKENIVRTHWKPGENEKNPSLPPLPHILTINLMGTHCELERNIVGTHWEPGKKHNEIIK